MSKSPGRDPSASDSGRRGRILVATLLAAIGGVLLWRALLGGGPLFYFLSAVFIGMGYAALQATRQR